MSKTRRVLPLQRLAVVEFRVSPVYRMAEGRTLVGHQGGSVTGTNRQRRVAPALRYRRGGYSAGSGAGCSLALPGDRAPASSSESEIIPGPRSTFLAASRRASHLVRPLRLKRHHLAQSSLARLSVNSPGRTIVAEHGVRSKPKFHIGSPPKNTDTQSPVGGLLRAASVLPAGVRKAGITASAKSRRLFNRLSAP